MPLELQWLLKHQCQAGEALSSAGGVDRIRRFMGVCPQFDILWGELTGQEHLQIFGRLKVLTTPCSNPNSYCSFLLFHQQSAAGIGF